MEEQKNVKTIGGYIYVLSTYDVEKNSEKKQEGLYIIFLFVIWNHEKLNPYSQF